MKGEVEFQVLGPLRVLIDDREMSLRSRHQQVLLAMLLVHKGHPLSADQLIDALWGEHPPASAATTLHTHLSRLRSRLGLPGVIARTGSGYSLQIPFERLDSARFERLISEGRQALRSGDATAASRRLQEGLGLWRGAAFGALAEVDTVRTEAGRLEELKLTAVEERVDADLVLGRHSRLIGELEVLAGEHPFRERFWGQLMVALYRSGRQAEALRTYQQARAVLGEELGIEPSPELHSLEEQILLQDPALQPPPASLRVPPAGTVTFLMTEIENSTWLWEEHPEGMKKALARHHQVMGDAFDRYGGYVFSTAGDGYSAAFHRAQEAMAAAVDSQQSLQSADWGRTPIKVRMVLHSGEAEEQDGDYLGSAINRCARLLAAGHGGQVLVSVATRELIGDNLPAQVELLDLGKHRPRNLERPEHFFQLAHPDLDREFPPLRSLATPSHNLPVQLTSFVGRAQELAELDKLVRGARLVTLTGAGGSGKTRLALQVATDLLDEFPDGVWLVELAALAESGLVIEQIAAAFALKQQVTRSVTDVLYEYLQAKRLLLIVDNCEHIVDKAADAVSHLLTAAPEIRLMATSREPLRVPSEVIYQVPTMDVPDVDTEQGQLLRYDGVRLLVERAEHTLPGFRLTKTNARALATITRRLDGIPLAIELAAARLKTFGADAVASRLDDQIHLLATPTRGVPNRHQTLHATIDWSYQLLNDMERSIFGCLSVFRGSFDLAAVESLCAPDDVDVFDTLGGLVDKSLVLADPSVDGSRFRLLETIREFADQTLTELERTDLHRRHAIHYAERVADVEIDRWEDETAYLETATLDHDNLLAALHRSLSTDNHELSGRLLSGLRWYWWSTAIPSAARQWVDTAITGVQEMQPLTAALTYLAGGTLYLPVDLEQAGSYLESSVALLENLVAEDDAVAGHYLSALHTYGAYLWFAGEADRSIDNVERTLEIARRFGYRHHEALGLNNLSVAVVRDDPARAVSLAAKALEIFNETGPPSRVAEAMGQLGIAEWHTGDRTGGEEHIRSALDYAKDHGHMWEAIDTRQTLAELLIEVGRFTEVLDLLEENLAVIEGTTSLVATLADLASAASRIGDHETAAALSNMVRKVRSRSGHSSPGLSERLDGVESDAQTSLSAQEIKQAVERGEQLDLSDLTDVIAELRTRLTGSHFPTKSFTD